MRRRLKDRNMASSIAFALSLFVVLVGAATAKADTIFSDNFNSGASSAWSNSLGDWTASGGVYRAENPDNFPNTHSFVSTFPSLTDFSVTVDINNARDGGVWLRASPDASSLGVQGVLLIFLNDSIHSNTLFWHEVTDDRYGAELNTAANLPLGNFSLRIDVQGDLYSAYINGSSVPATTFTSDLFSSGFVGVYDHDVFDGGLQSFDNFALSVASVPGPVVGAGLPGLILAVGSLISWQRLRRKTKGDGSVPKSGPAL
jgi:hypothetical protein